MVQRFDSDLVADFIENRSTILVPNQRIRDAVLHSYGQRCSGNSFRTPDVNAIDVWIRKQWQRLGNEGRQPFAGRRVLTTQEEALIWLELIEQSTTDRPLLNTDESAASAQQAYQLFRLWLDAGNDAPTLPTPSSIAELDSFRRWAKQFQEFCNREAVISLADATQTLVQSLQNAAVTPPARIVLVNFYQPPPLYARLFALLTDNETGRTVQTARPEPPSFRKKSSFPDLVHEAKACAEWARSISLENPDHHIGIIHSGDSTTARLLERVFINELNPGAFINPEHHRSPLNVSSAAPSLLESGLLNEAWLILNLGIEQQDSIEFCRLLRSDFILASEEELEGRVQLESHLREVLENSCNLSQLIRIMGQEKKPYHCPLLAAGLLQISTMLRENRSPRTLDYWANLFARQLQVMGWPGQAVEQEHHPGRLLEQWRDILTTLSGHARLTGKVSRGKALACLRALLQNTRQRQFFNPASQVSFYTLADAVGIDFSHTWLFDFSDQNQPSPPSPNPFLPHESQRQAGIPGSHSHGQLQNARHALAIVSRSTATEIRGSFHLQGGDEYFRESSLLAGFESVAWPVPAPPPLTKIAMELGSRYQLQALNNDPPVPLRPDDRVSGGQAVLSDQSSCPFRAYARHRLQATPLTGFRNGLDPRARGTATHVALEHLFKQVRSRSQLLALDDAGRDSVIAQSAKQALDYLQLRFPEQLTPRFRLIETERLGTILADYLELETTRSEFEVIATESPVSWRQDQLSINLKIDRIDRLGDGSLAVLDYKTGKTMASVSRLTEARPENLQLPVYFCAATDALEDPVNCVVIAQVNRDRTAYSGLAASDNFHALVKPVSSRPEFGQDWQQLTDEWRNIIEAQAASFIAGQATVDPVKGNQTCRYCDLHPVCRIQELQPLQELDDDEGPPS